MFRMPLMLQIVKHAHRRARRQHRRCKSRIEHYIDSVTRGLNGKHSLLTQNSCRAEASAQSLPRKMEIGLPRNQVLAGLEIRENEVFVRRVDPRQSGKQFAQVNLRPSDAPGNQIQRIDADARHAASSSPEMETATAPPECEPSSRRCCRSPRSRSAG